MQTVKARKHGSSIVLTTPKAFNIQAGDTFMAYQSQNGSLIFSPKLSNPFLSEIDYHHDPEESLHHHALEALKRHV